jgi:hypothetical protein
MPDLFQAVAINRLEFEIAFHERFLRCSPRALSLFVQKRS